VLAFKLRALFVDEAAGGPAPSAGSIEAAARRLAGGPSTGSARPGR